MTTKIFLARHAEAEGNLFRVAHGQYDSNLTPRGYRQLRYLRERFREEKLEAVYGSDLTRAHATASALYVPRGLAFRPEPRLREVRLGDWEERTWAEIARMDRRMYADFNQRPHLWQVEGAETFAQVRDRMVAAVRDIARAHPGGTVAAASHGAALRTLLGTLEGMTLEEIGGSGHGDNTAVSLLEVDGDHIRVVFRDDNSHVPPEASTFRRQSWFKDGPEAEEPGLWFAAPRREGAEQVLEGMLGDRPAGQLAWRTEGDALRLTDFAILPAHRGGHLGVQLLGQAVKHARHQGREALVLTCPRDLRGYFAQYGFESAGADMVMDLKLTIREIP